MIVFILGQNYSLLYIKFNFNILIRLFKKCPKKYLSRFLSNTLHHKMGCIKYPGKRTPSRSPATKPGIQKMPPKYLSKNYNKQHPPILYPFLYFLPFYTHFIKPQHNGRHVTTSSTPSQTIKVTPRNWEGGRRSE